MPSRRTTYLSPSSLIASAPTLRLAILAGFLFSAMGPRSSSVTRATRHRNRVPPGSQSRQDVGERRLVAPAALVEAAFEVQRGRPVLGPEVQEERPALVLGLLGLRDRLHAVDLARGKHERLRAVVLD